MGKINILDKDTFSRIAAGEVVERPASCIKELLENSLDAGSTEILVEIENGGLDLLKIIDNGKGIENDDLRNAFMPHATSKIKTIEDIFSIRTLGFRGEALASIASVAKVLLKSKSESEKDGMEIYIEGGEEKYLKYSPIEKGTQVEVRDLFYNVPARLKFLKTTSREASIIGDIILRLALSRPDVSFTYINSGKEIIRTYGDGSLNNVIRAVYNRKTAENVTYFSQDFDGFRVSGFLGNESLSRGSRNQQTLLVNKRYVKAMSITAAVEQAFKSFITVSKFPFFVLFLDVNPEEVDVNVHPQKAEVKFSDDRLMFKAVFDTVHKTLREIYQNDLGFLEESPFGNPLEGNQSSFNDEKSLDEEKSTFEKLSLTDKDGLKYFNNEKSGNNYPYNNYSNNFSHNKHQNNNFNSSFSGNRDTNGFSSVSEEGDISSNDTYSNNDKYGVSERYRDSDLNENYLNENRTLREVDIPVDLSSDGSRYRVNEPIRKFPLPRIIGQFDRTYILAELGDTLYLIDQHAAHEKVNFEKYMKELETGDIVIQPLLTPNVIELSVDDYSVAIDNMEVLKEAGFTIEDFGDKSITVREVPYFLGNTDVSSYINEILDNLKNMGKGTPKETRYMRIATTACKASVKANDELREEEMKSLLDTLSFLDEPFTCPHGRPTMVKLTRTQLEKMFRRI